MKGKILIEADGKQIHLNGTMLLRDNIDAYEVIRSLAVCIGVTTPEQWAALVYYSLSKIEDKGNLERTEIKIPIKEEPPP